MEGALLSKQKMGKVLHKVFKDVINNILQVLPIMVESGSEVSYLIPEPRNFAEVVRLSEYIKKPCVKVNSQGDKTFNQQSYFPNSRAREG